MKNKSNPIINSLMKNQERAYGFESQNVATNKSILKKGIILAALLVLASILSTIFIHNALTTGLDKASEISKSSSQFTAIITISIVVSIVSFILVLVGNLAPKTAKYVTPIYILGQGYIIGLLNAVVIYATKSPVIGITAGVATLVVFLVMFLIHSLKIFRVTNQFRKVMLGILLSFILMSLISTIVFLVTKNTLANNLGLSPEAQYGLAIAINVGVIIFASLFLLMDFANAEIIVKNGLSKDYEWVFLLGLFVTLIWIYLKIFQLLVLIFGNRK